MIPIIVFLFTLRIVSQCDIRIYNIPINQWKIPVIIGAFHLQLIQDNCLDHIKSFFSPILKVEVCF